MKTQRDRVIALAGLCQAVHLVDHVARHGHCAPGPRRAALHSLLQRHPEDVEAVYGGLGGVEVGLRQLHRLFDHHSTKDRNRLRYAIQLIQLDAKLQKRREMVRHLAAGIEDAGRRLRHFDLDHPTLAAHFAGLYSDTISTLRPRILVRGEPIHLNDPGNANWIRALLLAGIRSARLWRQCGGHRLGLLLGRRRILDQCADLLTTLEGEEDAP